MSAEPVKKGKVCVIQFTKINTITSEQMALFQAQNALKTVFGQGIAPDPTGGAYNAPPDRVVGWGGGTPPHSPLPSPP